MRIIRIITRLNVGGPTKHAIWLSHYMKDTLLIYGATSGNESSWENFQKNYDISSIKVRSLKRAVNPFYDIAAFYKIIKIIFKEKPDIIHTHQAKAGFLGRLAGFLYKIFNRKVKIFHTFHGHTFHSYFSRFKNLIFLTLEKITACFSDYIIAISRNLKKEITGKYKITTPDKVKVIPLGIDFASYKPPLKGYLKERFKLNEEHILIAAIGRLAPIKRFDRFIELASLFKEEKRFKFLIIGDGGLKENLIEYANKKDLKNIIFCGEIAEPEKIYSDLKLICVTSDNEGTPLAVIEGMYYGIPSVAADVGGIKDLINFSLTEEDYKNANGIKVKKDDLNEYKKAIDFILKKEEVYGYFRENSLSAAGKYDIKRLISDLKEIYNDD